MELLRDYGRCYADAYRWALSVTVIRWAWVVLWGMLCVPTPELAAQLRDDRRSERWLSDFT